MKKQKRSSVAYLIVMIVILLLALAIMNPNILFFLGQDTRDSLSQSIGKLFDQLPSSIAKLNINLSSIVSVILLLVAIWCAYQIIAFIFDRINFKNRRRATLKGVALGVIRYAAVILAVVWTLVLLGVNTTAIFASVGIVALVISMGAQTLFTDIITGIFIIAEGQYQVGDIISVDGFRGRVVSLGIRTTKIMDDGGNVKIINNADVRNILNLTNQVSVAVCDVSISYNASIEKAEEVIAQTVKEIQVKYPDVFPKTPTYSGVQALAASSVDLRVVAQVEENNIFKARRLLNREMKLAMDKAGIEIPFNQIVVHKAAD